MKKVHIKRKELKKAINDLEKAFYTFGELGCYWGISGILHGDEEKKYDQAGMLLGKSITTLKNNLS